MKLLLDECVPRKLKFSFVAAGHECETVHDAGLSSTTNGALISAAEQKFDVLITVDRNMRYQQRFSHRKLALLVVCSQSNDLTDIIPLVPLALAALATIQPGQIIEVGNS